MPELETRQEAYRHWELQVVKQTLNALYKIMSRLGKFRNFPNDYLVIDYETTGVNHGTDLITQAGHCLVIDRKPVDRGSFFLDWTKQPGVDQRWLRARLIETRQNMMFKDGVATGKQYNTTYERLQTEGTDPKTVLQHYHDWFLENRQNGFYFVAHNGYKFDARMAEDHFRTFLHSQFRFGDNELLDTGMIEKGAAGSMLPWEGDTLRTWSTRVGSQWLKGIPWNLDKHCIPHYGIDKKHNLDMTKAHDAGEDCYMTYLLLEHWRDMCREGYLARGERLQKVGGDHTRLPRTEWGMFNDTYWEDEHAHDRRD